MENENMKAQQGKRVYISLLISGRDVEEVKERAEKIKAAIRLLGDTPVSPFDICLDGTDYNVCMGRDIEALLGCDAVYFAWDWAQSPGCRLERYAADVYHIEEYRIAL